MRASELKKAIREIPDFPKPGINYYDVSTLFLDAAAFKTTIDCMVERYRGEQIDAVAAVEARGFVLASALAYQMGIGMVMVRKRGKLPGETEDERYTLEYGESHVEVHRDAIREGQRVLVVDDLLATGGTAAATGRLIERLGGQVLGYAFMVELCFLDGRRNLNSSDVFTLIRYET
ncbi:MAG: adenine phosphoribosyltransferase [bacterium]|nr:adenine phosphoribosyltransferase [bacterium]